MTSFPSAPRLRITLLGVTVPGLALALALRDCGHDVVAVCHTDRHGEADRSDDRGAEVADAALGQVAQLDLPDVPAASDLVIVSSAEAAAAATDAAWSGNEIPLLTGAMESAPPGLPPTLASRAVSVDPLTPLSGTSVDIKRIRGAHIAISGPPATAALAGALCAELDANPVYLADQNRLDLITALNGAHSQIQRQVRTMSQTLAHAGVEPADDVVAAYLRPGA